MSQYQPVSLYDADGVFVGYAIHKLGTQKLSGPNIWGDDDETFHDLTVQLRRLNDGAEIRDHWPARDDPEFLALVNDPDFEPIEHSLEEVVDDSKLQAMIKSGEIEAIEDELSGNIRYSDPERVPTTLARVPKDPSAPQRRYHKAAETIARKRAGVLR